MVFPFAFEMLALLLDCNGSFLVAIFPAVAEEERHRDGVFWRNLGNEKNVESRS